MSQYRFNSEELQQLYRYACAILGTQQDAYDLLQSALEKYLKQNSVRSNPMAYMRTIMRNTFIDQIRHEALIQWDDYEGQTVSADLNWNAIEKLAIDEDEVQHCIAQMSGIEREIMFLWAVEGYSTAEVAEQLAMPKNTLLSRIHRLRQKIKNHTALVTAGGEL